MAASSFKQRLGCWLHERWRVEVVLRAPWLARRLGWSWRDLCNRHEQLREDAVTGGRRCGWSDSSALTVSRVFPAVAQRLLRHVRVLWPFRLAADAQIPDQELPTLSVLIPFGGRERLPQLRACLASLCGQQSVDMEVIVVEQSAASELAGNDLPKGVRLLHQHRPAGQGFNKSAALNFAAQAARGKNLLLIDADFVLPESFAAECCRVLEQVEGVRPVRLMFYLDRASSEALAANTSALSNPTLDVVVANTPMPIALRASTYWEIGGHDESYVGWGGEDTEFLDRLRTRNISEGGWMPALHVWHAPAPKKADGDRNREHHLAKMKRSAMERIASLIAAQATDG